MSVWQRALRATQRFLRDVNHMGDPGEQIIHKFSSPNDLEKWMTWSDQNLGGKSSANLEASPTNKEAALFHGQFSTDLDSHGSTKIKRSGFVGMSTSVTGELTDLEGFERLVYRIRGDGRIYIANIRTDNWLLGEQSDDAWQAPLYTRATSEWHEVEIPLEAFVLTHKGKVLPSRHEMHPGRVISMGIALAGGDRLQPSGPFKLEIEWIKGKSATVQ